MHAGIVVACVMTAVILGEIRIKFRQIILKAQLF